MATKTMLVDDFDGDEATETIHFGLDGKEFAVDVNEMNAEWVRELMAPLLAVARKVPRSTSAKALAQTRQSTPGTGRALSDGRGGSKSPTAEQEHRMKIRNWARENGWPQKSNQGVISKPIMEAYRAAHPDEPPADQ